MKVKYLVLLVFFLIVYYIFYKYFFDGFCYIRSDDYLKCASTMICEPDRNVLIDPNLTCIKKQVPIYEIDSFLYKKETYVNFYNNFIDSIEK